jgi:hypothetical protein
MSNLPRFAPTIACAVTAMVVAMGAVSAHQDREHPLEWVAFIEAAPTADELKKLTSNFHDGTVDPAPCRRALRAAFTGTSVTAEIAQRRGAKDGNVAVKIGSTEKTPEQQVDSKLVAEHVNYELPYYLLALELELLNSVRVASEPPDVRRDKPMRSDAPPRSEKQLIISLLANLIADGRDTFSGAPRKDLLPARFSNLWTYNAFGSKDGRYDPDLGVCGSVFTGLQSGVRMGLLDYADADFHGLSYGDRQLDRETLIGRLADVCAWTLAEAAGFGDTQGKPVPEMDDVRQFVISPDFERGSSHRQTTGFTILRIAHRAGQPTARFVPGLADGALAACNVESPSLTLAYHASSLGFSVVSAADILERILRRNVGRHVGQLHWSNGRQGWVLNVGTPDDEEFVFQVIERGLATLPLRVFRAGRDVSAELDELVYQLANVTVYSLSSAENKLRRLSPVGTEQKRTDIYFYAAYRFFKSLGFTHVIGNWPYYRDFVEFYRSNYADRQEKLKGTGNDFWGLILMGDDAPLFARP